MPRDLGMTEQHQSVLDYFASFKIVTVIIVNYLYCVVSNFD